VLSPQRWQRAGALFHAATALADPAERDALIATCEDAEIRAEVLSLLAADAGDSRALESPQRLARTLDAAPDLGGRSLGPWRLIEEVGRGGMGVVYRAERSDGLYAQQVAIKLLRGFPGAELRQRFERERRLLARLEHPGIARLLDGGHTDEGQPWLAMEFVDGMPLNAWCARAEVSPQQRLALWLQVVDAVAYAHGQLVLHRDLKPANVRVDQQGRARLLDFGIGAWMGEGEDAQTQGLRLLTPGYASPEQARGETVGVTSDVYSLGVILRELMPEPPRAWRRDLVSIIERATREEAAARYASAAALGEDLRRLLAGEPVLARAGGWRYRSGRFLRRHRLGVVAALMAVGVAIAFTLGLVRERDRALAAEARAEREARTAERTADLLVGLFRGADPFAPRAAERDLRSVLAEGLQAIDAQASLDPQVRARLYDTLGAIHRNLGLPQPALQAWAAAERLHLESAAGPAAAYSAAEQALLQAQAREIDAALASAARARAHAGSQLEATAPGGDTLRLAVLVAEAAAFEAAGQLDEALARLSAAEPVAQRLPVAEVDPLQRVLEQQGEVYWLLARYADSERVLRAARERVAARLGEGSPALRSLDAGIARALRDQGRGEEAVALYRSLLQGLSADEQRSAGAVTAQADLGAALHDLGRYAEAETAYRAQAEAAIAVYGADSPQHAMALNNLGTLAVDRGDPPAALPYFRESMRLRLRTQPERSVPMARMQGNLGDLLSRLGAHDEAQALLDASLRTRLDLLGPTHFETVISRVYLGVLAVERGRADEARAQLKAIADSGFVAERFDRMLVLRLQGRLALLEAQPEVAVQHFADARAFLAGDMGEQHPDVAKLDLWWSRALLAAGQREAARQRFIEAARVLRPVWAPAVLMRREMEDLGRALGE
jgi:serine/threonine-protein kinase